MENNALNTASVTFDLSNSDHIQLLQELIEKLRLYNGNSKKDIFSNEVNDTLLALNLTRIATIASKFDAFIDKHPHRINSILRDFSEQYFDCLSKLILSDDIETHAGGFGPAVLKLLNEYKGLKIFYVQVLEKVLVSGLSFDAEIVFNLLERVPILLAPLDHSVGSWHTSRYEHFKLITHELFLYTVAISLKNQSYSFLEALYNHTYFIQEGIHKSKSSYAFTGFGYHYDALDQYYKNNVQRNSVNVQAEIILSNLCGILSKDLLVKADMVCHYVARLNLLNWFPIMAGYHNLYRWDIDFFYRLVSKRHFERVKDILHVETVEDLVERIKSTDEKNKDFGMSSLFNRIPLLDSFIDVKNIGTLR